MYRPTRVVAALAGVAMLTLACGSADDEPTATSADGTEQDTDAEDGATDAGTDGDAAEEGDTRTVSHHQGESEVPSDPQRVVTLDSPHLDTALSLGVTPVGAVRSSVDEGLPPYLGERTEGIEIVGTIEEPDLEAIASLQPDLILSATVRHEAIYDQLSQIAPTVFTETSGTNWQEGFTLVADALNRADEGEQALADYEQQADEVGQEVGADGMVASIVRFLPDETRVYGPDTFSGTVLTDIGFSLPELEYHPEYSMAMISPEQIDLADADVMFATTYGDPEETTRGAVTQIWENLDAVASGCQFDVDDREWMLGIGLIGAEIILDDVAAFLSETDCG